MTENLHRHLVVVVVVVCMYAHSDTQFGTAEKKIQTYPWSLESLFKKSTKHIFSFIFIMQWTEYTLNLHHNSQSLHDCPFPPLDPKIRCVQLVYWTITGKNVSLFLCLYHSTYCASIRTDNSHRANNSSSALVNNRRQINLPFQHCASVDYIALVVTMVPCGPFGPRIPFAPKSPGGP